MGRSLGLSWVPICFHPRFQALVLSHLGQELEPLPRQWNGVRQAALVLLESSLRKGGNLEVWPTMLHPILSLWKGKGRYNLQPS